MKKNIAYIDSLKGIGSIIIAIYHISGLIGLPNSSVESINKIMNVINDIGYIPVEMFFFFSGYLMLYNYSDKIKDIDFFEYIKKKIIKIYPFLCINIIACSLYILITGEHLSLYQIFYNMLFLQSGYFPGGGDFRIDVAGGGTWFLAPLFLSYVIFFYICKYRKEETSFGLYGAIVIIGMIALKNNWNYPILNGYMLRGLLGFFAGCMFSLVMKKYGFKITKSAMLGVIIILILYISIIYHGEYSNTLDFIIITDIVILPCIIIIFENIAWIQEIFSSHILKRIGALSLQLFLLNLPVGYFFKLLINNNFTITKWNQYVLYFISLFAFSLLFEYIVKKLQKNS